MSLFTFCNNNDDTSIDSQAKENNIQINTDVTSLNKRLDLTNSDVIKIINVSTSKLLKSSQTTSDLPLVQITQIDPPTDSNGRTLQANHVAVNGNYAYVAYTMSGDVYSGAIDVIDVSDPYKPKLITSALNANTDITSLTYSNGNLIITGATDIYKDATLTTPSIIINMQLSSGLLTDKYTINNLEENVTTYVGGTFNMRGTLAQGKYQQQNPTELIVNSNATLQIEGSVVIWGDLRLNSGAKINFIGNGSSITIYGKVTKNSGVTITGNYKDTENKLK